MRYSADLPSAIEIWVKGTVILLARCSGTSLHHNFARSARVVDSGAVRKLIFFCSADPREDTGAFFRAYHFANVAAKEGVEAEVRLAGPAVDVTDLDTLPNDDAGDLIRTKIRESIDAPFGVSF